MCFEKYADQLSMSNCLRGMKFVLQLLTQTRDLVRCGAPGTTAALGVFENLLNKELQFQKIQKFLLVVAPGVLKS